MTIPKEGSYLLSKLILHRGFVNATAYYWIQQDLLVCIRFNYLNQLSIDPGFKVLLLFKHITIINDSMDIKMKTKPFTILHEYIC